MTRNQCRVQTSSLIPCPCGSSLMRESSLNAEFPQPFRPDGLLFSSSIRIGSHQNQIQPRLLLKGK